MRRRKRCTRCATGRDILQTRGKAWHGFQRRDRALGGGAELKGGGDLVAEADRASEAMIRERLTAAFPTHGIYGEEGTRDQMESEFRWYVDPLDGTTNFSHGFPAVCVALGLERRVAGLAADAGFDSKDQDGEMVAGVFY